MRVLDTIYNWIKDLFMTQVGQAPDPGQDAAFLNRGTSLRVVQTGTMTFTVPVGFSTGTIYTTSATHNLGFVPAFLIYQTTSGINTLVPYINVSWTPAHSGLDVQVSTNVSANITTIDVDLRFGPSGAVAGDLYTFKYYLYVEGAT